MENVTTSSGGITGRWLAIASSVVGIALVISAGLIARGYAKSKDVSYPYTVVLTGQADRVIESDTAKWSVRLTRSAAANATSTAAAMLKQDGEALRAYVKAAGIDDADFSFQPVKTSSGGYYEGDQSYTTYADQIVVIQSKKVQELGSLAEHATDALIEKGITLYTDRTEFFADQTIRDVEKELAQKAVQDAREQAASFVGKQLGKMRALTDVRYTVAPEYAMQDAYSYSQDTSSIKKKVTAYAMVTFDLK